MSLFAWCLVFALNAAWFYWMVYAGGAEWLEPHVDEWFDDDEWTAAQLRSMARVEMVLVTLLFALGLFVPDARFLFLPSLFEN